MVTEEFEGGQIGWHQSMPFRLAEGCWQSMVVQVTHCTRPVGTMPIVYIVDMCVWEYLFLTDGSKYPDGGILFSSPYWKGLVQVATSLVVGGPGHKISVLVLGRAWSRWRLKWKTKKWHLRECRNCFPKVWLSAEDEGSGPVGRDDKTQGEREVFEGFFSPPLNHVEKARTCWIIPRKEPVEREREKTQANERERRRGRERLALN